MESTVWQTVRDRCVIKESELNKWGQKEGDILGQSNRGAGEQKNKRKQVQLCRDKSLSIGNPAVDGVDEGKH